MYLAHHLLTLAYEHEFKLHSISEKHNLTYVDQVLLLRSVGTEQFLNQMKNQRDSMLNILRDCGNYAIFQISFTFISNHITKNYVFIFQAYRLLVNAVSCLRAQKKLYDSAYVNSNILKLCGSMYFLKMFIAEPLVSFEKPSKMISSHKPITF